MNIKLNSKGGRRNEEKYWLIALVIIVFLILAVMGLFGMRQRKRYRGEIFEGSTWLLTWEELYEVAGEAKRLDQINQEVHILYRTKEKFNADIEGILDYLKESCGEPYYATRGSDVAEYISKEKNTGAYEEELAWIVIPGSCLNVRMVRIGTGTDAPMKVILTLQEISSMQATVVESEGNNLLVELDGEEVLLTWLYLTGKRYISETTPLYQPGDELLIAVQAGQEVKHYDGNAYGTLGAIYIEKIE